MREILFRGKRVDIGEWVESDSILYIDKSQVNERIISEFQLWVVNEGWVYADTIGQFTGLLDKNGKKIFEGDIMKLGTGEIRFVFYGCTSFRHTNYGKYAKEFDNKDKGYEVIGNIYDNPELLEDV